MADSRTIQINLKAVSDFSDVLNNAKQIQNALSGLKLPKNLEAQFQNLFSNLEKNGKKAADTLTNGFKTKGDVSGFEKASNQVVNDWKRIGQLISSIDVSKLNFSVDSGKAKELSKAIEQIKTVIDSIQTENLTKVQQVASEPPSSAKAWKEFFEAFKENRFDDAEKALKRLTTQLDRAREAKKLEGDSDEAKRWQKYANGVEVYSNALQNQIGKTGAAAEANEELNKKLEEQNNLQKQANKNGTQFVENLASGAKEAAGGAEQLVGSLQRAAEQSQHVNSEMDHFKSKIAYFFGAQNAVNLFKRALQSAFATVKDLDAVMTETAVVTKFDVGDMWDQLPEYTQRANELGVSIHSAYEAATIYYQQGLETNQVMEVSNQTLKMARIAGLEAAEATDRMTNALRGFNMEINETNAERIADVYSKLAAISASNVDEISTAMTKTASLASNANMEFETTAAFLAQIIETTRESAETAGTALKTVIARFSEVKKLYSTGELLGTDEEGEVIDVNKVSQALRSVGVDLNEYLTGMKGLDDIFLELASKWDTLDQVQQRYIATTAAGSRQQSRFIAMMQDYGRTQELVSAAQNASGAAQEQYAKTLESLETKLTRLKNAWDEFVMGIANSNIIKGAVDVLTNFITAVNKLTGSLPDALKGVSKLAIAFGAFKVGRGALSKGVSKFGALFMKDTSKIADKSSANFVDKFKGGFQKYFGGFKKEGTNVFKKNVLPTMELKASDVEKSINEQLKGNAEAQKAAMEAFTSEANGTLDLKARYEEANKAAQEHGSALKSLESQSIDTEKAQQQFQTRLQNASTVAMGVGAAFTALGGILRDTIGDEASDAMMTFGGVLTGLGALLPTLGSAFMSMGGQAATAGTIAQAGWGWIGLVLAAVAALITVAITMGNEGDKALEKIEKRADKAAEATKELQNEYDNLKSSIEEITAKANSLDQMVKGTTAWKEAVQALNLQVLSLIEDFPELIKYLEVSDDGIFSIKNEGFDKVLEQRLDEISRSQSADAYLKILSNNKKAENEAGKLSKKVGDLSAFDTSALEKMFSGRIGSEDRAFSTDFMETMAQAMNGTESALVKLEQTYGASEDLLNYLKTGQDTAGITSDIEQVLGIMRDYGEIIVKNNAENRTQYDVIGSLAIDNLISTYGEDVVNSVRGFLDSGSVEQAIAAGAERQYSDFNETEKNAYETYFKDKYGDDVQGFDSNGKVRGLDLTAEEAMAEYQASQVPELLEEVTNGLLSALEKVPSIGEDFGKIFSGEQKGLTKSQYDTLSAEGGISQLVNSILENSGYEEGSDGYELLEQILTSELSVQVVNAEEVFKNNEYNPFVNKGASAEAVRADQRATEAVRNGSDSKAFGSYLVERRKLLSVLDEEETQVFGEILADITDFSDKSQIENIPDAFEAAGISTEHFSNELDVFVKTLINGANAIEKANAAQSLSRTANAKNVIDSLKGEDASRNISEEDYNAISEFLSEEEKGNFYKNLDDSYTYLGNSMNDLVNVVSANTEALIADTKAYLDDQIAGAEGVEKTLKYNNLNAGDSDNWSQQQKQDFLSEFIAGADRSTIEGLGIEGLSKDTSAYSLDNDTLNSFVDALINIFNNKDVNIAERENLTQNMGESLSADQVAAQGGSDSAVRMATVEEANAFGLDPDEIIASSNALQELNKNLKEDQAMADRIALDNARMNASLKTLSDNWEDWKSELQSTNKGTAAYNSTVQSVQKAIQGLTGSTKQVSKSFATSKKAMDLLERAANDDKEAIAELRKEAARDIIMHMGLDPDAEKKVLGEVNNILDSAEYEDLEIGANLETTSFYTALQGLLDAGAVTADQMNAILETIGFEPTVEYEEVKVDSINQTKQTAEVIGADGEKKTVHLTNDMEVGGTISIPRIGNSKFKGSPAATISPNSAGGSGGGGGGGGGGGEKEDHWDNPYDELYNLTEKINENLRKREDLERRYQKLVDGSNRNVRDVNKNYNKQIKNLQKQRSLLEKMQAGRKKQLKNVKNEKFRNDDGKLVSFKDAGVTKYASYNAKTGLLQIDWKGLEKLERSKKPEDAAKGKAAEAYISRLEELQEQLEGIRDQIWDVEDKQTELNQQRRDAAKDMEQRIYDSYVALRESEIEAYQTICEAIDNANQKAIDNLNDRVSQMRQDRQNERTEQEIADKENRLAYLKRDTSGAYAVEIQKLEKELEDARENYTDTLIDQAIDQMAKDADVAAEQRQRQLDIMNAQLELEKETGAIWETVQNLILNSMDSKGNIKLNSELMKMLQKTDGFNGMSAAQQKDWLQEAIAGGIQLVSAIQTGNMELSNTGRQQAQNTSSARADNEKAPSKGWVDSSGFKANSKTGVYYYDPNTGEPVKNQLKTIGEKTFYFDKTGQKYTKGFRNIGNEKYFFNETGEMATGWKKDNGIWYYLRPKAEGGHPIGSVVTGAQIGGDQLKKLTLPNNKANGKAVYVHFSKEKGKAEYYYESKKKTTKNDRKKFATGGLADFTGPAWLDGSKSKPELVLNARDTENFIQLKDILAKSMLTNGSNGSLAGDNYFDIDIQAEIGSDYDVDRLADKIKSEIQKDSAYRNVNAIHRIR